MRNNIVAIVGRPNVGKSTLFNRLTQTRDAIVDETSGVTRDRNYGKADWNGHEFSIIDTGGYVTNSEDVFQDEISKQVMLAIEEADVIMFVVDVITGVTDLDEAVADILRRSKKNVILVVNKVDNNDRRNYVGEFYSLGLGELYSISSVNGSGTGELLDRVVELIDPNKADLEELDIPRVAIVGRPNVGKSSTINVLLGEDRNIVTDVAGTTRDSLETRYNKFGHDFIIVDTAWVRKKNKVHEDVEFYSVLRSIRSIEDSDVCLLILDATRGVESQDMNILSLIQTNKKGLVILVNKWDLIEKDHKTMDEFKNVILEKIAPFTDVPIIFTSALTKQRIFSSLDSIMEVYENKTRRIQTAVLNEYMLEQIENYGPPAVKGKFVKIKYVTQLKTNTPTFVFYANLPQYIKEPYKRYLENKLRKRWNFKGVPVNILIRKK